MTYSDPIATAKEMVAALRPKVDVLIAVTHLPLATDVAMVQAAPGIDLVIGGHEHENYQQWRGAGLTPITKADGNARTVYIHNISFNATTRRIETVSRLQPVGRATDEDPAVAARVQGWVDQAYAAFRSEGFEPDRAVTTVTEPLDGREASVRNGQTRLTDLVAQGMLHGVTGAEWAVFNSGSIRIDDVLPPGPVSEYDIIRTMPFGGDVLAAEVTGVLLQRVLDQGVTNRGTGGFLQTARTGAGPLDPHRTYLVAINDFLLTGSVRATPAPVPDIRQVLIAELKRKYPPEAPTGTAGGRQPG